MKRNQSEKGTVMSKRVLSAVMCAAAAVALAVPAGADEKANLARKILHDYGKAVVQVEAILSLSAEGPLAGRIGSGQEQKVQIAGTVVDPSGLTVVSYVNMNPTSAVKKVKVRGRDGQQISLSIKGELSDVKIVLPDGTEIPARVVLKDEDLDMAFIMPKEKLDKETSKQIQAVDLSKGAAKAKRLDQVVRLGRLGKGLNRELVIRLDRISAVITKPRTFYVLGGAQPGTPVFAAGGKLLGVIVFHKKPGGESSRRGAPAVGGTPVVLPAKDVKKIADQAREELAKPPTTRDADDKAADDKDPADE